MVTAVKPTADTAVEEDAMTPGGELL